MILDEEECSLFLKDLFPPLTMIPFFDFHRYKYHKSSFIVLMVVEDLFFYIFWTDEATMHGSKLYSWLYFCSGFPS